MLKIILISILLSSCSHMSKKEVEDDTVSMQATMDLTRSSYLKGCVDGIKHFLKKETKGYVFNFCTTRAKLHESDIRKIVE